MVKNKRNKQDHLGPIVDLIRQMTLSWNEGGWRKYENDCLHKLKIQYLGVYC